MFAYADDLKIFSKITDTHDCIALQNNLDSVDVWCKSNGLNLNVGKCQVMTFSKKFNKITFDYIISGVTLKRPEFVRDLGVIFDSSLSFREHQSAVVSSCFKKLGCILRNSFQLCNTKTFLLLFTALIRSSLEYANIIWHSGYKIHVETLESVQRRFLKFLAFREDGVYPCRGFYEDFLCLRFCLQKLDTRNKLHLLVFLWKLINNDIKCDSLIEKLKLNTKCLKLRDSRLFYVDIPKSNVYKFSPFFRMCSLANNLRNEIDVFCCDISTIRTFFA